MPDTDRLAMSPELCDSIRVMAESDPGATDWPTETILRLLATIAALRAPTIAADEPKNPSISERHYAFHETVPLRVIVDVDKGIADAVTWLNTLDGVRTFGCCQGGKTYEPYVTAWWPDKWESEILARFAIENQGDGWAEIVPHENASWEPLATPSPTIAADLWGTCEHHAPDMEPGRCETQDCHIDPGVYPFVMALWNAGIRCAMTSCQGGGPPHSQWDRIIRLHHVSDEYAVNAFWTAKKLGLPVWYYSHWFTDEGTGWWELLFEPMSHSLSPTHEALLDDKDSGDCAGTVKGEPSK